MSIFSIFKSQPKSSVTLQKPAIESATENLVAKREVFKPYNFVPADHFPGCEALYDTEDFQDHLDFGDHNEAKDDKWSCYRQWNEDNEYYNFTQEAETVHAPFLVKALVVALARKSGVPTRALGKKYYNSDTVIPMKGADSIPSGYGSMSREIIIFTDLVDIAPFATSGDNRFGWEYGHSTAIFIGGIGTKELSLTTNQSKVESSQDIEDYLSKNSLKSIIHKLSLDSGRLNITVAE